MNPELVKLMQSHFENPTADVLIPAPAEKRVQSKKRFLNCIIDVFICYLILLVIGMILAYESDTFTQTISNDDSEFGIWDGILALIFYGFYMSVAEAFFKGKSIGKMITKTKVVNLDGSEISVKTAFARGFSRAIPFSAFSAFGSPSKPWQDRWTKTMVIDDSKPKFG